MIQHPGIPLKPQFLPLHRTHLVKDMVGSVLNGMRNVEEHKKTSEEEKSFFGWMRLNQPMHSPNFHPIQNPWEGLPVMPTPPIAEKSFLAKIKDFIKV